MGGGGGWGGAQPQSGSRRHEKLVATVAGAVGRAPRARETQSQAWVGFGGVERERLAGSEDHQLLE